MKSIVKLIAVILVFVSIIGLAYWATNGFKNLDKFTNPKQSSEVTDGNGNILIKDQVNEMPESLIIKGSLLASGDDPAYIAITIKATIKPDTANNKRVDWYCDWREGAVKSAEDVSTYLTVTAVEDGSNQAIVKCFKRFDPDKIIIKVVTRENQLSATCTVSYVGKPLYFTLGTQETINIPGFKSVTLPIKAYNGLGEISNYNGNFVAEASVRGEGHSGTFFELQDCYAPHDVYQPYEWFGETKIVRVTPKMINAYIELIVEGNNLTIRRRGGNVYFESYEEGTNTDIIRKMVKTIYYQNANGEKTILDDPEFYIDVKDLNNPSAMSRSLKITTKEIVQSVTIDDTLEI